MKLNFLAGHARANALPIARVTASVFAPVSTCILIPSRRKEPGN